MYTSREHIRLIGLEGTENVDILPCSEFDFPRGKFKNLNYARIMKKGEKDIFLKPGQVFGETVTKRRAKKEMEAYGE